MVTSKKEIKSKYNLRDKTKSKSKIPPDDYLSTDDDYETVSEDEDTEDYEEDDITILTDDNTTESDHKKKKYDNEINKIKYDIVDKNGEINNSKLKKYIQNIVSKNSLKKKYFTKKNEHDNNDNTCTEDDDDEEEDDEEDDSEEEEEEDSEEEYDDEEDDDEEDKTKILYNILRKLGETKKKTKKHIKENVSKKHDKNNEIEEKTKNNKKNNKHKTKNNKTKTKQKNKEIEEDDDEDHEDEDDDDSDYKSTEDPDCKKQKMNFLFSIRQPDNDYYENDIDEEMIENEEDEDCNSDDEKTFMKENYQMIEEIKNNEKEVNKSKKENRENKKKNKGDNKGNKKNKNSKQEEKENKDKDNKDKDKEEDVNIINVDKEYIDLLDLKKCLTEKLKIKPNSKILKNAIIECNNDIKKLITDARKKNTTSYKNLVIGEKNKTSEIDYFKKKLSNKEQLDIMKDLKEINQHIFIEKPYRLSILQSKMPSKFKQYAIQKINMLRSMEPSDPEYFKINNWVDTFMKIPFNIYKDLSVNMNDGIDVCNNFLENAKKTLDDCVYGLDDAKLQIMQMMGQWISNPSALGTSIAIKGPAGTGKTSLVKNGISKILGREFAFIALGGAGDGSFLEGHSYTYEGSVWGKIVQILIDSKCMNPIIYFDELDKISDSPRGQEIIGILTHLTDTSQNNQFHDKYFSEIDFDLSKCLFIFSYNDEKLVNPILRDRMYCIQTKGYDVKEKTIIAKNFLLPKIREQVNFNENDVIVPDETIQYIINSMTKNEDGVRNLKRSLEIIHTKLNLFRLVKPENNMFSKQIEIEVVFPFTVTKKHAELLIKSDVNQNQSLLSMYI
jgi:ATP-dependent Lon protease